VWLFSSFFLEFFAPELGYGFVTGSNQGRVGLLKLFSRFGPAVDDAIILLDDLGSVGL
jgi:hypothetical protein